MAVTDAKNITVKNTAIITIDITGLNTVHHGATHNAEKTAFDNCKFIGTTNLYMVGGGIYNGCFGNVMSGIKVLPLSKKMAKSYLLGSSSEIQILNDLLPELSKSTANFHDYKYLGENVFIIAPALVEIEKVCGNTIDDIPLNFDGTVLLYKGDYTMQAVKYFHDVELNIVGIGRPRIKQFGYGYSAPFNACTNFVVNIKDVDIYTYTDSRFYFFGMNNCYNATVNVYNCKADFRSSSEKRTSVAGVMNGTTCKGIINGGSVLSQNGLNWSIYNQTYNNVVTYTNSYLLPTGTINNNALNLDAFNHKIVNVADGTAPTDGINLRQLQAVTNELITILTDTTSPAFAALTNSLKQSGVF